MCTFDFCLQHFKVKKKFLQTTFGFFPHPPISSAERNTGKKKTKRQNNHNIIPWTVPDNNNWISRSRDGLAYVFVHVKVTDVFRLMLSSYIASLTLKRCFLLKSCMACRFATCTQKGLRAVACQTGCVFLCHNQVSLPLQRSPRRFTSSAEEVSIRPSAHL